MSEQTTEVATPLDQEQKIPVKASPAAASLPEHLRNLGDDQKEGLEESAKYQATPMIKVVHPTSKPDILEEFGAGSALLGGMLLAGFEEKVRCNLLFFWPSWTHRRDNADQSDNFIIEESFDPNSELAARCRNPKLREVPYPANPKMFYKNAEQLNFIMQTLDESNDVPAGTVFIVAWSLGGHKVAKRLNSYTNGVGCPLYCNVISLEVTKSSNAVNEWYQLDWSLEEEKEKRFITQEQLLGCKDAHVSLKEGHANKVAAAQAEPESDGSGG